MPDGRYDSPGTLAGDTMQKKSIELRSDGRLAPARLPLGINTEAIEGSAFIKMLKRQLDVLYRCRGRRRMVTSGSWYAVTRPVATPVMSHPGGRSGWRGGWSAISAVAG